MSKISKTQAGVIAAGLAVGVASYWLISARSKAVTPSESKSLEAAPPAKPAMKDGIHVARAFSDAEEVEKLDEEVSAMERMPNADIWKYYDGKDESRLLGRVENFYPIVKKSGTLPGFSAATERAHKLAADLLGVDTVTLWKEKVNFKKAGGQGFAEHQDAQAGWEDNNAGPFLNIGIAIDDCTLANGCLEVIPGQWDTLVGPKFGAMPDDLLKTWNDGNRWQPMPLKAGDAVVFDAYMPHRSAVNGTDKQRRLYLMTFVPGDAAESRKKYHDDKWAHHPPEGHTGDPKRIRGYII